MRYKKQAGVAFVKLFLIMACGMAYYHLAQARPVAQKPVAQAKPLKSEKKPVIFENKYKPLKKFAQILHLVEGKYVKKEDVNQLVNFSIKGLLSRLDPHSQYFSKQEYKEFQVESRGNFAGVGIEVAYKNSQFIILSVIKGGPAYKAGLKPGDILFQLSARGIDSLSMEELSSKIRGKIGSSVKIKILRGEQKEVLEFSMRRKIIKIKNVTTVKLGLGYEYIKIKSFSRGVAKEVNKILKRSLKKNKKLKGLILDLRFNPGGLLYEATQLSDLFLSKGVIVEILGRNKKEKEVTKATPLNTYKKVKIIVLINAYSASASEIVAAALKENKRALIMGETSFGKGSVQNFFPLEEGGAVKLTIAHYYTPNGHSIQKKGVVPNIHIKEVDTKLLKKAVLTKTALFNEASFLSSLKQQVDLVKKTSTVKNDVQFDFFQLSKCKKTKYKKSCKLLSEDFSISQAFNYLKVLDSLKN
ncbi:MAG: S41 family peptidase [Bdellovibrionaceae bacterium]|nr:S41 family peptidase [Pseudobdellovibrionaceae bacterium]